MDKAKEYWIDYIKVLACVLVVLGHFFQSMVKSGIISESNVYVWFNTTIYYFHVPLFFICSGYLYQSYGRVKNIKNWICNIKKKFIVLGMPYFVFSTITWTLKTAFSNNVNDEVDSLMHTLFIHPTAPYWYLYVLFFLFFITPTFDSTKKVVGFLLIAFALKMCKIITLDFHIWNFYAFSGIASNEIWFMIGIIISHMKDKNFKPRNSNIIMGIIIGIIFLCSSFFTCNYDNGLLSFVMGLMACVSIVLLLFRVKQVKCFSWISNYTLAIFLMHTIIAAPIRIILIHLSINNLMIHIILGLTLSFLGPVIVYNIMKKLRIDFMVHPNLKRNNEKTTV